VVRVSVDGVVHPITVEIVGDALSQARQQQASAVLLRLNTPGGLLEAARKVIEEIVASPIPVVAYVGPSGGRAASAGFLLLEAGDLAAMAPGTHTGAASPVLIGQTMDTVMRAKVENDTAALLRGLTSRRGRNSEIAEKAIRDAKAFTDKEALDNNLIDLVAESESELFSKLDGRQVTRFNGTKQVLHLAGVEIVDCKLSLREKLIEAIADPNIGFILLVVGALGLYIEFSTPGVIAPGVFGALLLLLALSSLSVLPINWLGAALLVLAISLFVLEAKVISHGVLGTGGVIAMALGAVILVNGPPELRIHLSTALGVTLPFAFITFFLVSLVVKARRSRVLTGLDSLVGEIGVAQTALAPAGQIFIRGEYWNAVSPAQVGEGTPVRVTGVDGLTLRVEAANPPRFPESNGEIWKGESKT
jgi:membrane-bound serine protease (ClpP class)